MLAGMIPVYYQGCTGVVHGSVGVQVKQQRDNRGLEYPSNPDLTLTAFHFRQLAPEQYTWVYS